MPSWIKEQDGLEWYDERFTSKETNKSHRQLQEKVTAGGLRHHRDRAGVDWYAKPDVEDLRDDFLKRRAAAKGRRPSVKQLEKRYAKQADELCKTSRHFHGGPLLAHGDRVTLANINIAAKKPSDEEPDKEK